MEAYKLRLRDSAGGDEGSDFAAAMRDTPIYRHIAWAKCSDYQLMATGRVRIAVVQA